ncbi:MAG: extracellular solute-binding protein [Treponema sp.]|jgi:ABC-type glycerol-3-phosphate transport system substrate-binding protein|nr:extracellular solute-binding protein [Treponema sp.]
MKRILCLVLGLVVLGSSLAFAGGRQQEAATAKTVIRLGIWPADTNPDGVAIHEGYVKKFNEKYPDVVIEPATFVYGVDTFVPQAAAGRLPTMFVTWFTEVAKLIDGGYVRDITPELQVLGWDTKMEESVKEFLSRDGRIYGYPEYVYALGLMLNVELFREAGLVDAQGLPLYPKTWDELAITAQTIKQKTGAAGFVFPASKNYGGWHYSPIACGFGAELEVQRNGRWIAQLNSPEAVQAMSYIKDLKWKYDALTPDPTSEDNSTGYRNLATGMAAMWLGANTGIGIPAALYGLPIEDIALVPIPTGPKGQYGLTGGNVYFFEKNATSEQVSATLYYLELMGNAPVATDAVVTGLRDTARFNQERDMPNIPGFPVWKDSAFLKAQEDVLNAFANVDIRLYNDFFAATRRPDYIRAEEPMLTQDIYAELTRVCQAVLTDRNANVQTLLDGANQNIQRLLDSQVNN